MMGTPAWGKDIRGQLAVSPWLPLGTTSAPGPPLPLAAEDFYQTTQRDMRSTK